MRKIILSALICLLILLIISIGAKKSRRERQETTVRRGSEKPSRNRKIRTESHKPRSRKGTKQVDKRKENKKQARKRKNARSKLRRKCKKGEYMVGFLLRGTKNAKRMEVKCLELPGECEIECVWAKRCENSKLWEPEGNHTFIGGIMVQRQSITKFHRVYCCRTEGFMMKKCKHIIRPTKKSDKRFHLRYLKQLKEKQRFRKHIIRDVYLKDHPTRSKYAYMVIEYCKRKKANCTAAAGFGTGDGAESSIGASAQSGNAGASAGADVAVGVGAGVGVGVGVGVGAGVGVPVGLQPPPSGIPGRSGPATPRPSGPATPSPSGPATPSPSGPATPSPSGPAATPSPSGPATPGPSGPATPSPSGPAATPSPSGPATPGPSGPATPSPSGPATPSPSGPATPSPSGPAATPSPSGPATPTPTPSPSTPATPAPCIPGTLTDPQQGGLSIGLGTASCTKFTGTPENAGNCVYTLETCDGFIKETGTYTCDCSNGFVSEAGDGSTITSTCSDDSTWSDLPKCIEVCQKHPKPDNTKDDCVHSAERTDGLISDQETYTCTCSDNYASNTGTENTITATCNAPTWTTIATCVPVCVQNTQPANTENDCQHTSGERTDTLISDQGTFACTCSADFASSTGNGNTITATCTAPNWSDIACIAVCAAKTGALTNTDVTSCQHSAQRADTLVVDQTTYTCTCNAGMASDAGDSSTISETCNVPNWTPGATCVSVCTLPTDPANSENCVAYTLQRADNLISHTGTRTCTCSAGYGNADGTGTTVTLTCTAPNWSTATCVEVCPVHATPANTANDCGYTSQRADSLVSDTGTFTCTCAVGYASDGGNGNTISVTCGAPNWGAIAACVRVCAAHTKPANTQADCAHSNTRTDGLINDGETYTCTCLANMASDAGDSTQLSVTCSNSAWTTATCVSVCTLPTDPANSENCVAYTLQRADNLISDTGTRTCTCSAGYGNADGTGTTVTLTCTAPNWSTATCVEVCTLPTDPANSENCVAYTLQRADNLISNTGTRTCTCSAGYGNADGTGTTVTLTCTAPNWSTATCVKVCEPYTGTNPVNIQAGSCGYSNIYGGAARTDGKYNKGDDYGCTCAAGYGGSAGWDDLVLYFCNGPTWITTETCVPVCEPYTGTNPVNIQAGSCTYSNIYGGAARNDGKYNKGDDYGCTCAAGYGGSAGWDDLVLYFCEGPTWITTETCVPVCEPYTGPTPANTQGDCGHFDTDRQDGKYDVDDVYGCTCAAGYGGSAGWDDLVLYFCEGPTWETTETCVPVCDQYSNPPPATAPICSHSAIRGDGKINNGETYDCNCAAGTPVVVEDNAASVIQFTCTNGAWSAGSGSACILSPCDVAVAARIECGPPGLDWTFCAILNCCYDAAAVVKCFNKNT